MNNQALELSLLKFKISVTRDRLRDLGTELGILVSVPFSLNDLEDVDKSLFGDSYRKEPLIPFTRKHAVAVGAVAFGVLIVIVNHHLSKK